MPGVGGGGGGALPAKLVGNLPFREREAIRGEMSCWRQPTTKPPGESQGKLLTTALRVLDPGEVSHMARAWSGRSPACCKRLSSQHTRARRENPFFLLHLPRAPADRA